MGGRSRSGRVSIKPLAFWANEVASRTPDGGYVAEGDGVRIEARTHTDFTASFRSERLSTSAAAAAPPPAERARASPSVHAALPSDEVEVVKVECVEVETESGPESPARDESCSWRQAGPSYCLSLGPVAVFSD